MKIGQKIKDLRILMGLTQEELASRAELSKSFISQVERDLTSPSIATLEDILQCLGTNISDFFSSAKTAEPIVFSLADYFEKQDTQNGYLIRWLIPNAQKNMMEPIFVTLEKGGSTLKESPHPGEEFGYLLQGSITLHLGSQTYKIKKGESFYFTPDKDHFLTSKGGASLLWISAPPTF